MTPGTAADQASLSITNSWKQSSNSCPLRQWCHPTISSSVGPFSCLQSFPAWGSLPVNIQDWFPLEWIGWISLKSKGLSRVFSQHHSSKALILPHSTYFIVQLSHPHMTAGKTIAWTRGTLVTKVMSLLYNVLSRLVINFLPRSKYLLITSLQSPSAVILQPPENSLSLFPHLFAMKWWDQMPWS